MTASNDTLQNLLDLEAIRRLKHYYYCHCVDRAIAGDRAALDETLSRFTADAVTDFTGFPLAEGIDAVRAFYTDTVLAFLGYSQHRVMNEVIDVAGERARGSWYLDCPVIFREGNPLGVAGAGLIIGRYEETYRREAGVWKWERITALLDVVAGSEQAWSQAQFLRVNR